MVAKGSRQVLLQYLPQARQFSGALLDLKKPIGSARQEFPYREGFLITKSRHERGT